MQSQLWHSENRVARLKLGRVAATVDLQTPARGVHDLRLDASRLERLELLQVDLEPIEVAVSADAIESFLRGGDLAVTYANRPNTQMRTQIYWRAARHKLAGAFAALELLVSVQTDLLDSFPKIATGSRLPAQRVFRMDDPPGGRFVEVDLGASRRQPPDATNKPCAHLFHLDGGRLSYAEIVHPVDAHRTWLESPSDGAMRLGHELFARPLEKGVILRARVLGVLVDRAGDETAAAAHFAAFLSEELPLTT